MDMVFKFFATNVAIMIALSFIFGSLIEPEVRKRKRIKFLQGLYFGLAGLLVIANSYEYAPGIIFDCRSVILGAAGMFGGPVVAAIAVVIVGTYRVIIGGSGVLMGVLSTISSALVGLVFFYLRENKPKLTGFKYLYLCGLIIHIIMLLLILILPSSIRVNIYKSIAIPVIVLFPLAFVLLAKLLLDQQQQREDKEKLEFQSSILEHIADMVTATDLSGKIIHVNRAAFQRFTKSPEQLIGNSVDIFGCDPQKGATHQEIIDQTLKNGSFHTEIVNYDKDGNEFIVDCRTFVLKDNEGKPSALVGISTDITEHKRYDEQLFKIRQRFENVSCRGLNVVWEMDAEGTFTYVSDSCKQVWGYEPQELVGKVKCFELYPIDKREEFLEATLELAKNGGNITDFVNPIRKKDGTEIWVSSTSAPVKDDDGNIIGYEGIDTDITEKKLAQEKLLEQSGKLNAIIRAIPNLLFVINKDGIIEEYYSSNENLLLMPPSTVVGSNLANIFGIDDANRHLSYLNKCIRTGELVRYEYSLDLHNQKKWFAARLVRFGEDKVLATVIDITDTKESQLALAESEKKYRNLVEYCLDAVFVNEDNRITYANNACLKLFGAKEISDILGKSPHELFHPDCFEVINERIGEMLKTGENAPLIEEKIIRLDGNVRDVEVSAAPFDFKGKMAIQVALKDITDLKLAERQNHLLANILAVLNVEQDFDTAIKQIVGLIKDEAQFDAVGIRLAQNDDFPYFYHQGFTEEFIKAENSLAKRDKSGGICHNEDGSVCLECTCGLVLTGMYDPEDPMFTHYGSAWTNNSFDLLDVPKEKDSRLNPRNNCIHHGYASVALIPIRSGREIVGLLQLNDHRKNALTLEIVEYYENICESIGTALVRRHTQEQLRLSNESLKKATAEANLLASKAEAANVAKGQFLANMSHELRTPLNSIIALSELFSTANLTNTQKDYIRIIRKQGDVLLELVSDILDLDAIEHGHLTLHKKQGKLDNILSIVEDTFSGVASEKGLDFKIIRSDNLPEFINTDLDRLGQCLLNLVSNAIKFTEKGGVVLTAGVEYGEDESYIRFDVQDTGIGISEKVQDSIFREFVQADTSYTRRYGGAGLGLPIVKSIADLLGGKVFFKSSEGFGSVFTLLVPVGEVNVPAKVVKVAHEPEIKPKAATFSGKALIVEDSVMNQKVLEIMLGTMGIDSDLACDGIEAIEKVESCSYDLIFMDIQMPRMNGYDATKAIKGKGLSVPVIAVTAAALEEDRKACMDAGCDDYIAKPVSKQQLIDSVSKFLKYE